MGGYGGNENALEGEREGRMEGRGKRDVDRAGRVRVGVPAGISHMMNWNEWT